MSKDRRLGRGLAALLGSSADEGLEVAASGSVPAPHFQIVAQGEKGADTGLVHLNVYEIDDNPYQPRRDFSESEIASLAESLKEHDMLQPILVRRVNDRFQLISGERRLRAAILAGWKTVPVRVREADDRLVAELAIVENLQRKDLNPIEKALSFKRYLDEHGCTQEELANRLKIDRSQIANLMRLLELPQTVLDAIRMETLSVGHARALLPLGSEREQIELASRVQSEGLSVRDVEQLVRLQLAMEDGDEVTTLEFPTPPPPEKKRNKRTEQLNALEQEFRRALGVKVEISARSNQKGKIVIHYKNQDEFARIREQISGVEDGV